jgi:hypothetical protein
MYYVLIDPPVSVFSPPEEISEWISELRSWTSLPEFQYAGPRKVLDESIAEAEGWLERSRRYAADEVPHPPDPPAAS